jgi:hypothetical protein
MDGVLMDPYAIAQLLLVDALVSVWIVLVFLRIATTILLPRTA